MKLQLERRKITSLDISLGRASGVLLKKDWRADGNVEFVFDIHNRTDRKSPDVEAIYLHTGKDWTFESGGEACPSTDSQLVADGLRHFVRSPVPRLSPSAWIQIKLTGEKLLWSKYRGDELKDSYLSSGRLILEVSTSEGVFIETFDVSVEFDDVPF